MDAETGRGEDNIEGSRGEQRMDAGVDEAWRGCLLATRPGTERHNLASEQEPIQSILFPDGCKGLSTGYSVCSTAGRQRLWMRAWTAGLEQPLPVFIFGAMSYPHSLVLVLVLVLVCVLGLGLLTIWLLQFRLLFISVPVLQFPARPASSMLLFCVRGALRFTAVPVALAAVFSFVFLLFTSREPFCLEPFSSSSPSISRTAETNKEKAAWPRH